MTSSRPYLLRALYDWILDNGLTPQVIVDASTGNPDIPGEHIVENRVTFNIHPDAVQNLLMDNHSLVFNARFGGVPRKISVAVQEVIAIYARENGLGMVFPEESVGKERSEDGNHTSKPELKLVK